MFTMEWMNINNLFTLLSWAVVLLIIAVYFFFGIVVYSYTKEKYGDPFGF